MSREMELTMKTMRWIAMGAVLAVGMPAGTVLAKSAAAPTAQSEDFSKAPKVIYLMRHAEKPMTGDKDPNLAPQGVKRAQALPALFVALPGRTTMPPLLKPDAIFATAPSKHSNRPIETIMPLAQMLHKHVITDYEDIEAGPLAKQVLGGKYAGEVVVICWHHGEIPHVAEALGVKGAPKKWNPDVFDQIWKIEYVNGQAQMTVVPEHLLPGDSM
jgi:hypothetical protein